MSNTEINVETSTGEGERFLAVTEGSHVIYVDEVGQEHHALVTAVWNGGKPELTAQSSINLVYVNPDPNMADQYGRQIKRDATSVVPQSMQSAHGRYWKLP